MTLASATVLTTASNYRDAVLRLRRLKERGLNGVRYTHAEYLIGRERRRLFKHACAVVGICVSSWSLPTVLFGLICVALAETSISDRRHNRHIEEMWERERQS